MFAQGMENWPPIVFRARVKSLAEAGGFLCLDCATPAGGVILPRQFSRGLPILTLCVVSVQLYWDCTFQGFLRGIHCKI